MSADFKHPNFHGPAGKWKKTRSVIMNDIYITYKLIFVYVDLDNEDVGKPIADYFGITEEAPKVVGYTGNDDGKKFVFDQDLTLENRKIFGEDFLKDKPKPLYKSDPIPE
ncbi:hypothetical protein M8C21_002726 [Ambrosia artemisiifolia]|uniref:Uncharacterized protein n=1 Tax=Ambrosia artemisiifolia TaxID=4212 RepID=A0AAD5CS68_AMBAR|nr:hypothetical protein M8C21_002726 [Ambrosia artemisiifolia]